MDNIYHQYWQQELMYQWLPLIATAKEPMCAPLSGRTPASSAKRTCARPELICSTQTRK